ncbi:hypothetical protein AKJ60_00610 [candidate division MSBL1 archaeon SCGC-AAA385M11]|nr:hypothetical protein AKJ60_00610 [candidate division MSBL1 archaeon SCGC-AAA385M11]
MPAAPSPRKKVRVVHLDLKLADLHYELHPVLIQDLGERRGYHNISYLPVFRDNTVPGQEIVAEQLWVIAFR